MEASEIYTIGMIAETLDVGKNRIVYVINREKLKPVMRIGIIRMFSLEQIEILRKFV